MRKRAIVVGSGAGGATVAKELQGDFDVTVLEAGTDFRRATLERGSIERLRRSRVLVDPRLLRVVYPPIRVRRTPDMLLVNGVGTGGTTTMATGNGIRMDGDLQALGLDLDREFEELAREIPITTTHRLRWHPTTRRLFRTFEDLGLDPVVMPKMGDAARCRHCGRCMLGCPYGLKWDSRTFLEEAVRRGARLATGCAVARVVGEGGRAKGVVTRGMTGHRFIPADLVVLAAGGFGTPAILEASGIACEPTLFVDPVLTVAARVPNAWQCNEIEMPFVVQRDGYILSPYFDWISSLFHPQWRHRLQDIVGIMIKLADENQGSVSGRKVHKLLTPADRSRLDEAVGVATEILARFGADPHEVFLGTVHAGHPGGMLPLTEASAPTVHDDRLPDNVFVADATLLPRSLGNPPILTIAALAKRVARICAGRQEGVRFGPAAAPRSRLPGR
jgi:choline dehydrogenase-like flavoprotein